MAQYDNSGLIEEPPSDFASSGWSLAENVAKFGISRWIDSEFRGTPQIPPTSQGASTGINSQGQTYPRGQTAATINPIWIIAGVAVLAGVGLLIVAIAHK